MSRLSLFGLGLTCCLVVAAVGKLCTPDQWEGYEGSTGGYDSHGHTGVIQEWVKVSYDAKNQRKASFVHYVNNDYENNFQMVERYGDDGDDSGRIYVVNLKNNKCWSKKLEKPFKKACIPADAKPFGEHYMGLKGKGGLLVSMYYVKQHDKDVTCVLTVSKQGDVIIPVGELAYGNIKKSGFFQPMGFLDITPGIANTTVFDIPPQCKQMEDVSLTEYLMREHAILGF